MAKPEKGIKESLTRNQVTRHVLWAKRRMVKEWILLGSTTCSFWAATMNSTLAAVAAELLASVTQMTGDGDGEVEGVDEGVGVMEGVGESEADGVGVGEGESEGVGVGESETDGVGDGDCDGDGLGSGRTA
jgi:hypothetical protein